MTEQPELTPEQEPALEADSETTPESEPLDELQLADEPVPPVDSQLYAMIALETEGLDVDEALAAVASLSELVISPETTSELPETPAESEPVEEKPVYEPSIPVPAMITLHRGQIASVLPAILLIGIGAWLTFTLTTSQTPPDTRLILTIALAGLGLAFITNWLSSQRWSRGALLVGSALLLTAIVFFVLSTSSGFDLVRGWPLFIVAIGASFLLTAFLAPSGDRRIPGSGILLVVAGLVALVVTMGAVSAMLITTIGNLWPIIFVALLGVWLLPFVVRRRQPQTPEEGIESPEPEAAETN
jgi:hypothetical protein